MCCKLYTSKIYMKVYICKVYIRHVVNIHTFVYIYTYRNRYTLKTHTYIFGLRDGRYLFLTIKYFWENYVSLYYFVIQVVPECLPSIGF